MHRWLSQISSWFSMINWNDTRVIFAALCIEVAAGAYLIWWATGFLRVRAQEPDEPHDDPGAPQQPETDVTEPEELDPYIPDPAWFGRERTALVPREELLDPQDFIGADENWRPAQELSARFVDPTDPRSWDDETFLEVLHATLETPTMIWTIVDQEEADWASEWHRLDRKLEMGWTRVEQTIAEQDWRVDMTSLFRDIENRDAVLHEVALDFALTATTGERALVAVG